MPKIKNALTKSDKRMGTCLADSFLRLSHLVSAFLILGIGVGLAILSFLLEIIYAKCKDIQMWELGIELEC